MEMFDEKFCWNIFIFDSQLFTVSYGREKFPVFIYIYIYSYFLSSAMQINHEFRYAHKIISSCKNAAIDTAN